jgi:hypothetical protein
MRAAQMAGVSVPKLSVRLEISALVDTPAPVTVMSKGFFVPVTLLVM